MEDDISLKQHIKEHKELLLKLPDKPETEYFRKQHVKSIISYREQLLKNLQS